MGLSLNDGPECQCDITTLRLFNREPALGTARDKYMICIGLCIFSP